MVRGKLAIVLARAIPFALSALLLACNQPQTAASVSPSAQTPPVAADTPRAQDEFSEDEADHTAPTRDTSELAAMTLPARPDWADKYAGSAPDERFFDIKALMDRHGFDRAHAVELQNHFRDLTRAEPRGDRESQYAEALRRAKAGIFEGDRDLARLAAAPFIVVFDLDDTLYDQRIGDPELAKTCHDFQVTKDDGSLKAVKLTPGLGKAIDRIAKLGGEVVLFSANKDDTCYTNASAWQLNGAPILEHPAIAGMLTNSHLVVVPKTAGDPVPEPSKDLRVLDESLSRIIIVDDNPRRLFQFRNVRVFKKFSGDVYCTTKDAKVKRADDRGLEVVADEIEDAVRYMKAHDGVDFATAYLPYTVLGRHAVGWLRAGGKLSEAKAVEYLRKHPELADEEY